MQAFNIYQQALKRVQSKTHSDVDALIVDQWGAMIKLNTANKALRKQLDALQKSAAVESFSRDIAATRASTPTNLQGILAEASTRAH